MKRLCPVCFTELPENANYCLVCGKCMRENVEQTVQYIGCSPVTTVVGINDCAIHVKDQNATSTNRLIIDRKQNLQELCGNVCQQHERFKRELLKAIDAEIQLVILVEHGPDIQSLEDVWFWENPRKHEVRWRMVNGKREKYVVSAKAVDGNQLYKSLCTIRDRYNVRFEFCEKKDTGKEIIRILSGGGGDPR